LCFDCDAEWNQPDDAWYDINIHVGPGKCEVEECDEPEYMETNFCWFHFCNAMDGIKPFSGKLDHEGIKRRLRTERAVQMYNAHVCAPNGETITARDLVDWSNEQIESIIWLADLNREKRVNTQFSNSGTTAKFSSLGQYVDKAMEGVTKKYMRQSSASS
jgi:hypothetical protein